MHSHVVESSSSSSISHDEAQSRAVVLYVAHAARVVGHLSECRPGEPSQTLTMVELSGHRIVKFLTTSHGHVTFFESSAPSVPFFFPAPPGIANVTRELRPDDRVLKDVVFSLEPRRRRLASELNSKRSTDEVA